MLRDMLKLEGFGVGRKHVRTVMDKMGIAAIYRQRNTSAPHPVHWIYHGCVAGRKFRASLDHQPGYLVGRARESNTLGARDEPRMFTGPPQMLRCK